MLTRRPIPLNEPVYVPPMGKTSALVSLRDLIARDFAVEESALVPLASAVGKALLDRTDSGRYTMRCTHEDVLRVVRLELASLERQDLARRIAQERRAMLTQVHGADAPLDMPQPPAWPGPRRDIAMVAHGVMEQMRAKAEDIEGALEIFREQCTSDRSLESLKRWTAQAGDSGAERWTVGYRARSTAEPDRVIAAWAAAQEAEQRAREARALLAGALCSWADLTGSVKGAADALGVDAQRLRARMRPRHQTRID